MIYFFAVVLLIALIVLLIYFTNISRTKRKIEALRAAWGKPKQEDFYFGSIERYAFITKEDSFQHLTQQTTEDIDLQGLFQFVDRTTSKVGQQFLYKKIVQPSDKVQNELQALIELFTIDEKLRLEVKQALLKLNHADAYSICTLLLDRLITPPGWFKYLKFDIIIIFALLLLSIQFPFCLILLLAPFTLNMILHYWNKNNTLLFVKSFPQLSLLAHVAGKINHTHGLLKNEPVMDCINKLKPFQRKARWLTLSDEGGIQSELSQVGLYLYELVKAFFLVEMFSLFAAVRELESKQSVINEIFAYVGKVDTALSIASLRAGKLKTCLPEFIDEKKELSVKNVYHPLIKDCVKNDLHVSGKSVLITGSNMSGKSTFLRTLAVNSVLAQSIYTCFADEFKSPVLQQFSSIRIDDNIFEGKSYYMQEVDTISSLLEEAVQPQQKIFFLDEVFKGTNTVERIAAGKAVLSYLTQRNHIVIVSTHDLELAELLKDEFDLYHFTETIEDNKLHFDHRIKQGPLKSTNAIRILEIADFPQGIIAEAKKLSVAIRR